MRLKLPSISFGWRQDARALLLKNTMAVRLTPLFLQLTPSRDMSPSLTFQNQPVTQSRPALRQVEYGSWLVRATIVNRRFGEAAMLQVVSYRASVMRSPLMCGGMPVLVPLLLSTGMQYLM